MIDPRLSGKVAFVTGANDPSAIGAAIARGLGAQGASVFITYFDPTGADRVLEELRGCAVKTSAREADLRHPAVIPSLFDQAERELGPVDILVNNAAFCGEDDTIQKITPEEFDHHFAVNARAPVLLMQEFVRRYRGEDGGCIINVSTDGDYEFPGQIAYGASKAALVAFTRSVAKEVAHLGIRVNAVSLGPIHTGNPSWITPELAERLIPTIPLGRIGEPEDVADVAVFLASYQARWLTGQVLKVGGGHST